VLSYSLAKKESIESTIALSTSKNLRELEEPREYFYFFRYIDIDDKSLTLIMFNLYN
jgi:hypothetical protein